jgi:nucleotide-binding universal stress UspA family protein
VLKEIAESKYQLLVIGAHFRPGFNRWMGILLDDVTNQLLAQSPCSVLVV